MEGTITTGEEFICLDHSKGVWRFSVCLHNLELWLCHHHCHIAPSSPHSRLLVASPPHRLSRMCQVMAGLAK